ncbi:hypothetical protein RIF29_20062 [Crotalaria pallida]|uniref:Uncharacterized protein n=1 Tax=Crotalaria pallida TaxID=3830 RepID=A0AAN9F4W4_CROPI
MKMEMMNAFHQMEMANNETTLTEHHQVEELVEDHEKALSSALRALRDLEDSHSHSPPPDPLRLVKALHLHLVGSIHSKLNRFGDSLRSIHSILTNLQNNGIAV